MISAEAPVLFAKAAQIFITELTLRAWIHTEDNKRRTLQVRHTHELYELIFLFAVCVCVCTSMCAHRGPIPATPLSSLPLFSSFSLQ